MIGDHAWLTSCRTWSIGDPTVDDHGEIPSTGIVSMLKRNATGTDVTDHQALVKLKLRKCSVQKSLVG